MLFGDHTEHFLIECFWEMEFDEFLGQGIEFFLVHAPEVVQEHAFHAVGPEKLVEGKQGEEAEQVESAQGGAFQDEVAEQQLGVPGDQRLVEIEEGVPGVGRGGCWHGLLFGKGENQAGVVVG